MAIWLIFIISLVAATIIANGAQRLNMKAIGASGMFFSGKKKLIVIVVIALILSAIVIQIFGIKIPKKTAGPLNTQSGPGNTNPGKILYDGSGDGYYDELRLIGDIRLSNSQDFSENRAWIQYDAHHTGNTVTVSAVIDTKGNIIWESDAALGPAPMGSDFKDGLSYVNWRNRIMIIDADGTVTFQTEQEDFMILGYGDEKFLVAQYVSDFNANEWQIGAIDKNGDIVAPFKTYEDKKAEAPPSNAFDADDTGAVYIDPAMYGSDFYGTVFFNQDDAIQPGMCLYRGENVYDIRYDEYGSKRVLINIETQKTLLSTDEYLYITLLTGFENGYATVLYEDDTSRLENLNYERSVCRLGTDGALQKTVSNDWAQYILSQETEFSEGLTFIRFNEYSDPAGSFFSNVEKDNYLVYNDFILYYGAYYNVTGELVIDFPQYRGKRIYDCGPFKDGYAAMVIQGADNLSYFTVIDKNGQQMFEPRNDFQSLLISNDKYAVAKMPDHEFVVLDMSGNILLTASLYSGDVVGEFAQRVPGDRPMCPVSCGMLRVPSADKYGNDAYINVEDGSVMGAVDYDSFSVTIHGAPSSRVNDPTNSNMNSDIDNSSASTPSFDDACETLVNYYKGYLQAINQQDISYLRDATPEQKELLSERVSGTNKDYIFTFQQIIIDLDTIGFAENGGTQELEFYAAFQFSNEPRSGNGDKEHGANIQFVNMIYNEYSQSWDVASATFNSDVTIGSNQRVLK